MGRALMEKIAFPTEKFQLGHTKVFFRAGALAYLEELRDGIVLKLVRWMQGQCYGLIRRKVYNNKNDQRELMKVIQRNFRKFAGLRDWGWFIIIQKTRPLIGQIDLTEELALLEGKAKSAYGAYEDQVNTKKRMEEENIEMEGEKKALLAQLQSEQGNLSEYTDRQSAANIAKTKLEGGLVDAGNKLTDMEASRQQATLDKKAIEDLEISIQKLEQEKTNRDHTIRTLNDEIANQDEVINKLNKEKKHVSENAAKSLEDLAASEDK